MDGGSIFAVICCGGQSCRSAQKERKNPTPRAATLLLDADVVTSFYCLDIHDGDMYHINTSKCRVFQSVAQGADSLPTNMMKLKLCRLSWFIV